MIETIGGFCDERWSTVYRDGSDFDWSAVPPALIHRKTRTGGAYCEEIQPRAPGPVHFARSTPAQQPADSERRLPVLRHGRGPCSELPVHRPGPRASGRNMGRKGARGRLGG
jgi:hypothetical protein